MKIQPNVECTQCRETFISFDDDEESCCAECLGDLAPIGTLPPIPLRVVEQS